MEALILDKTYETLNVLDTFESFIWTDRYRECGDFEVYMPFSTEATKDLIPGNYLSIRESNHYMVIESVEIDSDVEDGSKLTVKGRSLESLLDRRIVWAYTDISGNMQDGIEKLLNENLINPSDSKRKIPNFRFKRSTDSRITKMKTETYYHGETLYDAIRYICAYHDLGFRVLPEGAGGFIFELYLGEDRSYDQDALPWVVFSPGYDNMLNSNYFLSEKDYKNSALVVGSGEGPDRKAVEVSGDLSGLDRREVFVEAFGIFVEQTEDEEGNDTTDYTEYYEDLKTKGYEELYNLMRVEAFEGEIDATRQFIYGSDFFIGDLVQVRNEFGMEAVSRITEVVKSQDISGERLYPTFTST